MNAALLDGSGLLARLIGFRLYSVVFVMDYVQLCFDGDHPEDRPVFNCYVWPVIDMSSHTVADGEIGYADGYRSLIPRHVTGTSVGEQGGLRLEFGNATLILRPAMAEIVGAEIARLSGFADGRWTAWRPGEPPFKYLV